MGSTCGLLLALILRFSPGSASENSCASGEVVASPSSCGSQPAPGSDYACDCSGSLLEVTYGDTSIGCGAPLSIEQAEAAPMIQYEAADNAALYSLLLVNMDESIPVGPILHFGAANVPGSALTTGFDASSPSFNAYRGPDPPAFFPASYRVYYTYVWVLMEQPAAVTEPMVSSNLRFDIGQFRSKYGLPSPMASAYFISGFCVHPTAEWCPSIPLLGPLCNFARGPSGCL